MGEAEGIVHARIKFPLVQDSAFLSVVPIRPSVENRFSASKTKRHDNRSLISTPTISRCRMQIVPNYGSQMEDAQQGTFESNSAEQPGKGEFESESSRGYEESFAANFHILLPLLTKLEEDDREESEEAELHNFVDMLSDRLLSTHRMSPQLHNLRPFAKRSDAERICDDCGGAGEKKCPYCDGDGFLELDLDNFEPNFEGWVLAPPKRAVGNYFHCPLCGGRCMVRCVECAGSGADGGMKRTLEGRPVSGIDDLPKYAAGDDAAVSPAMKPFIMEDFLEEHKDRIEHTEDGLIILRAPKKRRGRVAKKKVEATDGSDAPQGRRRKRGRPRKHRVKESSEARPNEDKLKEASSSRGSKQMSRSVRSTNFLNTTNFKVGQKLSIEDVTTKNEEEDDENDSNINEERNRE